MTQPARSTITLDELLREMVQKGAADLHVSANKVPRLRIDEHVIPLNIPALSTETVRLMALELLTQEQYEAFQETQELDFAFDIPHLSRFRANIYQQKGNLGIVIRQVPHEIMTLEQLGLPVNVMKALCQRPKGLVLITGATGAGKTTTLASMVEYINLTRALHIVTIEDPIEYIFDDKQSMVTQREVGKDTHSFDQALKYALRQDPDVILVGEMRDLETIRAALTSAETGHLVLATLHTSDVAQTINRIVDVFPPEQQNQVRLQLSLELLGVVCQQLVPHISGKGRVLASEVLIATHATRSLIREQRLHQLYSTLQTARGEGMQTMNYSLQQLFKNKQISAEAALSRTNDPEELRRMLAE